MSCVRENKARVIQNTLAQGRKRSLFLVSVARGEEARYKRHGGEDSGWHHFVRRLMRKRVNKKTVKLRINAFGRLRFAVEGSY